MEGDKKIKKATERAIETFETLSSSRERKIEQKRREKEEGKERESAKKLMVAVKGPQRSQED